MKPDQRTKKKKKEGDWTEVKYREKLMELLSRSCNTSNYRRSRIARNFDYYYGKSRSEAYDGLLTLHETGDNTGNTPFVAMNADSISPKINLLLGELRERGFEIIVNAVNKDAIERKNAYERMLRFQMQMQDLYKRAAEFTGIPYGVNNKLPEDDESLLEYMDEHRDLFEELMEEAINYNIDLYKYEFRRKNLFLDLLVGNEVHVKAEVRNGYPQFRRINPLNCLYDSGSEDDYQTKRSFFLEAYYASIPEVIEKFELSKEAIAEMIEFYESGKNTVSWLGQSTGSFVAWAPFLQERAGWGEFKYDRILVVEAEWLENEKHAQKVSHDSYGTMHVHTYKGPSKNAKLSGKYKKDPRNSLTEKRVQIVRKATLIGGSYITNSGVCEDMVRSFSNPSSTHLNIISLVHNYNNQESVSLLDRLANLQDFKNYVLTIMQKEITTNVGSAVAVDSSRIDSDVYGTGKESVKNLLHNLKAYKLIVYNGRQDGIPDNSIPIKEIQPRSQAVIGECLSVVAYLDSEMEKISGINESRQGLGGERQLASVTAQRVGASQLATDTYFDAFRGFEVHLFERHAKQVAQSWVRNPQLYENIAARLGIEIPEDFAMDLQDYKIFIRNLPMAKRKLLQLAEQAVLANNLPFRDLAEILEEYQKDPNRGIRKWLAKSKKREKEMLALQQQQAENDRLAQENAMKANTQSDLAKVQAQNEGKKEVARITSGAQSRMNKLSTMQKDRSDEMKAIQNRRSQKGED